MLICVSWLCPYTTRFRSAFAEAGKIEQLSIALDQLQSRPPDASRPARELSVRQSTLVQQSHALVKAYEGIVQRMARSEEHTSELQSPYDIVCRLLLEKKY